MLVSVLAVVLAAGALAQETGTQPPAESTDGQLLFQRDCATCHGARGQATTRGPRISDRGLAAIHYVITTGRMPIADPEQEIERGPSVYDESQVQALLDHAATFVTGPEVPDVVPDPGAVAEGGELYRANCAACHQFIGIGGVLIGDRRAPPVTPSTPVQVVEAMRVGPGTMPEFTQEELSSAEAEAIASYITLVLQDTEDPGGWELGHFGPVTEGLAAWAFGVVALLGAAAWIGTRT